ncbi:MAG: manganese transporter [Gemmataceae bacterium]|nr:manganese transporter [Gemmataceae bacterium]
MKRLILLFGFSCLVSISLLGCTRDPVANNGDGLHTHADKKVTVPFTHKGAMPIKVVCTIGMVGDIVRNIGGEFVKVEQLMGEDVDPHLYKVTSADVAKMNESDVIFYSGLHLEGKMTDTLEQVSRKKPAFPVAEYLPAKSILRDEDKHPDPHVWFDVSLWSQVAGVVGDALALYDPTNAAAYKKRTEAYRAELAKLHEESINKIASIEPKEKRVLITSHDAFRYFGRAYVIEVKGIQGISTDQQASLRDINQIVEFMVARKVKAVFVETSVNQRNMKSLLEGCKARGHEAIQGGELFSDAMGKEGTPEGTYIGMIRHNVDTIVAALK